MHPQKGPTEILPQARAALHGAIKIKGLPQDIVGIPLRRSTMLGVLPLIFVHHWGRDAVHKDRRCVTLRQHSSEGNSGSISTAWPSLKLTEDGNQQKPA